MNAVVESAVVENRPNQAAPVTLQQLREALAFVTEQYDKVVDAGSNVFEWLWEAIQGDFNQERSTGQVVFDTAISMVPGVDQVCDVRDIIANCRQINDDKTNSWAWVALGLTLIGLFPTLGSLLKGVLKIFFLFVRRMGGRQTAKAVDEAMTWVITLLRKREVQKYWKALKWDRVFHELAKQARVLRAQITVGRLLQAFDRGVTLMNGLLGKVRHLPFVGSKANATVEIVVSIRRMANTRLGQALKPIQDVLDQVIRRLELEDLVQRRGVVNVGNIHFRGNLPEARAVTLMRNAEPPPSWLSKGKPTINRSLDVEDWRATVDKKVAEGYPRLTNKNIESFTKGMMAHELKGPTRLYRVVSPSNGAMGDCWVSEEVWKKLMSSPDPKAVWRKHLAVWPNWNGNGQFVIKDIPAGETLKVWRGPTSAQTLEGALPERYLEGGWEQIILSPKLGEWDTTRYYKTRGGTDGRPLLLQKSISRAEWERLSKPAQAEYAGIREKLNDPTIVGPFDTGWGSTDFDAQLGDAKLGLPALPGQITNRKN